MAEADKGAAPPGAPGEPEPVLRRAPFSDNPTVGARGQRTQQRILDAALTVFGEVGYHPCSIDRIAKEAGCSRISFYQYFAGKEDVFRQLAGQVARQLNASVEALGPLTPDLDGWTQLRNWVERYVEIHARFTPVFSTFQSAVTSDEEVAGGSMRTGERNRARLRARIEGSTVPDRSLDATLDLLVKSVTAGIGTAATLRSAAPAAWPAGRVADALADVMHRTLFGLQPAVSVHPPARRRPPEIAFGPAMTKVLESHHDGADLTPAGRRTLEALLAAGRQELVKHGYHGTRVDDIVTAADLSHGAFYRYFENKDEFARLLAGEAMRTVSTAFAGIPTEAVHADGSGAEGAEADGGVDGAAALRTWLRRYNSAQAGEAALIRVWSDATFQEPALRTESAAVLDWGRRQMARFLQPRPFGGDVDTEAVVLVALLEVYGARARSSAATATAADVIERGLLGRTMD
ncbi:MAG: TetR/AcrR family transcriptional regulator [Acidimicrobiales bacterium]|nr:TetR/AcrR family transcriptional regulator [Acidimicrobiales bacterium]